MSQSDYLKYKKIYTEIKLNKLPLVLSSQDFTLYKQFTLENITDGSNNSNITYNRLIPVNKNIIFDIETNILDSSFSSFLCNKKFR
jgi:hypothetical protein